MIPVYSTNEYVKFISYLTRRLDNKYCYDLTDLILNYYSHQTPIFLNCKLTGHDDESNDNCESGSCIYHDTLDQVINSLNFVIKLYLNDAVKNGDLYTFSIINRDYLLGSFIISLRKLSPTTTYYWIEIIHKRILEYFILLGRFLNDHKFNENDAIRVQSVIIEKLLDILKNKDIL